MNYCDICGMPITKACGRESCIRLRELRKQLAREIRSGASTGGTVKAIAAIQLPGVDVRV